MNTDVEELLREGMERFTRDLRAPAGLIRRAGQRRRRRMALRSTGAMAALTAGAVALVAVVLPGARYDSAGATAYVVKRVNSALSAAEPGDIAQLTVTTRTVTPGGGTATTTAQEWSYKGQWRSVTYSSPGHPAYDEGLSSSSAITLVSYPQRAWARQQAPGPAVPATELPSGPRGCAPVAAALPLLFKPGLPGLLKMAFPAAQLPVAVIRAVPATVSKALRDAISCGTLTVAGRQRVDGIEAIELKSRAGSPMSETAWVSPGTYLPVRVVISVSAFSVVRETADIAWLPPTARNLAMLTVPVPAGFRHVSFAAAVTPTLPQFPWAVLKSPLACPAGVAARAVGNGPLLPAAFYGSPRLALPLAIARLKLSCSYQRAAKS